MWYGREGPLKDQIMKVKERDLSEMGIEPKDFSNLTRDEVMTLISQGFYELINNIYDKTILEILKLKPEWISFLNEYHQSILMEKLIAADFTIIQYLPHLSDYTYRSVIKLSPLAIKLSPYQPLPYLYRSVAVWPESIQYVEDQIQELCIIAIKGNPDCIRYIRNQTLPLCRLAVSLEPRTLRFIRHQTPELCRMAILGRADTFRYVRNPSLAICHLAVMMDPRALQYVKHKTPTLCRIAVAGDGIALQWVKNPTPELCMLAVKSNGLALQYVENPTPEMCLAAVKSNGRALQFVKDQTPEICKAAIQEDHYAYRYVNNPTEELEEAVQWSKHCKSKEHYLNGKSWQAIYPWYDVAKYKNISDEYLRSVIKDHPRALQLIDQQTPELCARAIAYDWRSIAYVKDKTMDLCKKALSANPDALFLIPERPLELFDYCVENRLYSLDELSRDVTSKVHDLQYARREEEHVKIELESLHEVPVWDYYRPGYYGKYANFDPKPIEYSDEYFNQQYIYTKIPELPKDLPEDTNSDEYMQQLSAFYGNMDWNEFQKHIFRESQEFYAKDAESPIEDDPIPEEFLSASEDNPCAVWGVLYDREEIAYPRDDEICPLSLVGEVKARSGKPKSGKTELNKIKDRIWAVIPAKSTTAYTLWLNDLRTAMKLGGMQEDIPITDSVEAYWLKKGVIARGFDDTRVHRPQDISSEDEMLVGKRKKLDPSYNKYLTVDGSGQDIWAVEPPMGHESAYLLWLCNVYDAMREEGYPEDTPITKEITDSLFKKGIPAFIELNSEKPQDSTPAKSQSEDPVEHQTQNFSTQESQTQNFSTQESKTQESSVSEPVVEEPFILYFTFDETGKRVWNRIPEKYLILSRLWNLDHPEQESQNKDSEEDTGGKDLWDRVASAAQESEDTPVEGFNDEPVTEDNLFTEDYSKLSSHEIITRLCAYLNGDHRRI